jgi:hypothetical protein
MMMTMMMMMMMKMMMMIISPFGQLGLWALNIKYMNCNNFILMYVSLCGFV